MPLVEESQFLFAFEDPTPPTSQLTWTVLPRGFRDSPHLFGQSLSRDLQNFNSSEAPLILLSTLFYLFFPQLFLLPHL